MNIAKYLIFLFMFVSCGERDNDFYYGKDPTEVFHVREFGENFSVEENFLGRFSVVGKGGMNEDFDVTKNPDRDLGHFSQSAEVIKVETVKKVDIVWSIDNSGSMGGYQQALASNLSLFIEDFTQKDVDFKMAIITTDSSVNKDTSNKLNSAELKKNKQGFIDYFKTKVKVGTGGSGNERSFKMAKNFLESNTAWSRSDALLVIIFVSDEEEGGNEWSVKKNPVKHYRDAIVAAKGSINDVRAFSICRKETCDRFSNMSQTTNGLSRDIKGSFSDISKEFGQSIVRNLTKLKTAFPLNITPSNLGQLKVKIDGVSIPKDTSEMEGWNYDSVINEIRFFGGHIPPANSSIKVYEEGVVESTFCFKQRINAKKVDSIEVEVNGTSTPRDTGEANGWNYDSISNCVEFFGSHRPLPGDDINISLPGEISNFLCLKNKLNVNHLDKLEVTKGGGVVPQDTAKSEGWSYNEQSNCIEFFGSHVLGEGDVVNVSLGLNSSFCLNENFDVNKLSELDVIIGGKTITRDTTGTMGWDYNQGNGCIELYGEHGLVEGLPVKISWGQTSRFCLEKPLDESKLETVLIKVDGRLVERGGSGIGWDYDSEDNCISFFGSHLPNINSKLEITYTPGYGKENGP